MAQVICQSQSRSCCLSVRDCVMHVCASVYVPVYGTNIYPYFNMGNGVFMFFFCAPFIHFFSLPVDPLLKSSKIFTNSSDFLGIKEEVSKVR